MADDPQSSSQSETKQQATNENTAPAASTGPISVKVVSAAGEEIYFKIKRNTRLSKLQAAYANKVGKDVGSIRFLYDGTRINDDDTPDNLGMDDNDTIDVMVEQVGGWDEYSRATRLVFDDF